MLKTFEITYSKPNSPPFNTGHNFDNKIDENADILTKVPYTETIGSLMHVMVC